MIKLVSFLRINFLLIIISFFLPFFPFFACEKNQSKAPSLDSTTTIVDSLHKSQIKNSLGSKDLRSVNKDSVLLEDKGSSDFRSWISSLFSFIVFSKYSYNGSDGSITGIGSVIITIIGWIEGRGFDDPGNYLLPLSFIAAVLRIVFSIKSKRKKQPFIFLFSMIGFLSISIIGIYAGTINLNELLFGYWIVAILYLINSLLGFILWKNFK